MYEGLTEDLLNRAIPPSLGVDVTSGFITDSHGTLSEELDCMVVLGKGEPIPFTSKSKYVIDDVVAVIQVKKNLYSSGIQDGISNLYSVTNFDNTRSKHSLMLRDAFQSITRQPFPSTETVERLPIEMQMIYHTLVLELFYPVRIIFGYNGFKSHAKFRQSFAKFLFSKIETGEMNETRPAALPTLIVCNRYSLVKMNGMPYIPVLENGSVWPFYCSTSMNPMKPLLELIWTRLSYEDRLSSSVFDDDKYADPFIRFIDLKYSPRGKRIGAEYQVTEVSIEVLEAEPVYKEWEPAFLDVCQFSIINALCHEQSVDVTDRQFIDFLNQNGYNVDQMVQSLNDMGLAALDGTHLVLLTRGCACVILPDKRCVAAENVSGQLSRWVDEYMRKNK